MQYCYLPASSLQVSRLSLGTMMFGGQTDESSALAIMDYAFDHGINVFDTANVYNEGRSEQIVGKALQGRRDRIILATKVRNAMGKDVNCEGLSRSQILYQAEQSLRRLNTDYIDIYYLHKPDYHTPIEETMEAVSSLVRAGKVRYIGVSNYAAWQLSDILALCDKRNYIAPVITQNVYNMITRGLESELLPCIDHHKVGLTIYNPIAGGLLAGKQHKGEPERAPVLPIMPALQTLLDGQNFDGWIGCASSLRRRGFPAGTGHALVCQPKACDEHHYRRKQNGADCCQYRFDPGGCSSAAGFGFMRCGLEISGRVALCV